MARILVVSTKPIPPNTDAKLREAQKHLSEIEQAGESTETFAVRLTNFLTAARSVKDVLINELARGDKTLKNKITPFITAAMNADPEMKTLVAARNATVHEGVLTLKIDWVPDTVPKPGDQGLNDFFRRKRLRSVGRQPVHRSRMVGMPAATDLIARAFLSDISDRDAFTVCTEYLAKVRKAADECVQKYG